MRKVGVVERTLNSIAKDTSTFDEEHLTWLVLQRRLIYLQGDPRHGVLLVTSPLETHVAKPTATDQRSNGSCTGLF